MKVKEFHMKQLEDDREFEIGYLEYLYELYQDSTAIEPDNVKLRRLGKDHSFHTAEIVSNKPLNNQDYDPTTRTGA